MICTECSKHIRPIVAVDIDGTLGMYHEHFRLFAQHYWDLYLRTGYDGAGKFGDHLGLSRDDYREAKLAYRQGGGKRMMPVFGDALSFMNALRKLDCEVWLTTTRPYLRLDSTDPDTRFWLEKSGMPYDYLLYDDDKYKKLAERVDRSRVLMIVDDLDTQIESAYQLFGPDVPVMVARSTNLASSVPPGVYRRPMQALTKEIEFRVMEWRANNE